MYIHNTTTKTIELPGGVVLMPGASLPANSVNIPLEKLQSFSSVRSGFVKLVEPEQSAPPKPEVAHMDDLSACAKPSELIAAASVEGVGSAEIERLAASGQDALAAFDNRLRLANGELLNPCTPESRIGELKREIDELQTAASRMVAALGHVQARLHAARDREAEDRHRQKYKATLAKRDALVIALAEYPQLAEKIVAILKAIDENNAAIASLAKEGWRSDETPIKRAEPIARKLTEGTVSAAGIVMGSQMHLSLSGSVKLPVFSGKDAGNLMHVPSIAAWGAQ